MPAAAASKPITGKLSKPGYSVMALAANGKARLARARHGRFRLKPPAKVVTLHLRASDGTYAGPIVVDSEGKRAILGVEAGADLGRISVRRGYAKVTNELPEESIDRRRWARAKKGVPIGARVFGRVRSKHTGGGAPGDRDLDGIPEPLDIDDDGDRILDNLDRSTAGRGARSPQADGCGPGGIYCPGISSVLVADGLEQTANANAGSTAEQIDTALSSLGFLNILILPGDSAELDCGDPDTGLVYCRKNGSTGRASAGGPGPPFPGCCDPDDDGFGTLTAPSCCPDTFYLTHGATTAQIKTGDVLIERVTTGGTETQFPATLQYVFASVPALVSYSDETGNQATVSYPVASLDPGTGGNGFPVNDGPEDADSDVELTLTFWRPQRQAIPLSDPPTAEWMDIGHLTHGAALGGPSGGGGCPQSAFSSTDPNLTLPDTPLLFGGGTGGFTDLKGDEESSPGNTLTYKLNLSQCLAAHGVSFNSGEERVLSFIAAPGGPALAQLRVSFKRQ